MRNYDFNEKLNWKSFQTLACEIVQFREKVHFQTFRDGADKGIDGLWYCGKENIVLQVKRYKKFADLYRELKTAELAKVKKLKPRRYILAVSLKLSEHEAEKIYRLFSGYLNQSDDLLDQNALNSYLSDPAYHWIEGNFTDLWIPDGSILKEFIGEIINKGSRSRNAREQKKAIEACRTFVQTGVYNEARAKLADNHTIVISGQPGMGKSTIARLLALDFLSLECYEGYYWVSSLEEIENEWEETEQKQVFILDDYWGAVFHRERSRKENYHLEELIDRFGREDHKRLIITAREYIIQQELFLNPELENITRTLKIECVLREYTDAEKAKILFAHLQVSDLDIEYVKSIFYHCDRLVHNYSYNPRVIDRFLKEPGYENYSPHDYAEQLLLWMEYPETMWKSVFGELSEEAKMILAVIAISYTPISLLDIRSSYSSYIQCYGTSSLPKAFENSISELEKTFLLTYFDEYAQEIMVEVENPSIIDFLHSYLWDNQEYYIPRLTKISMFYNQLLMLLEHFHCYDDTINQLIEKRCVEEFYTLPMKLQDYGERELGEVTLGEGTDWIGRAFHLMRLSKDGPGGQIWEFIKEVIKHFFINIEKNELYDGAGEMQNFVGLIRVCEEKGMHFDGRELMKQYWNHCESYNDYNGFCEFEEIYPKVYAEWEDTYLIFMKRHVKEMILSSLEYYDGRGFFYEEDSLVDSVPFILKDFGLYYTTKFKKEIEAIAGRYCESPKHTNMKIPSARERHSLEELNYEEAKREGYEQLIGKLNDYTDENVTEIVKDYRFSKMNEKFLLQTIEYGKPWYLHRFMADESSVSLLKELENQRQLETAERSLTIFVFGLLTVMTEGRKELITPLIHFCIDYAVELLYKEDPAVSEKKFKKMSCYKEYVEETPELETILFTFILEKQGKWIVMKQDIIVLFLLCQELKHEKDFDWDIVFKMDWEACLEKKGKENTDIYFPDFVKASNPDWIQLIQKIMNEIDEEDFRYQYVIPKLEEFLEQYGQKAERTAVLLDDIRWSLDIDSDGQVCGSSFLVKDTMILAENLEIADLSETVDCLTEEALKSLVKREKICEKNDGYIRVALYQEEDREYLRKIGIFEALEYYFNKLEMYIQNYK